MNIAGKVAIVTGGGCGIGRSITSVFSAAGADVVVADIKLDLAEQVAHEVGNGKQRLLPLQVDVSNKRSVDAMVERVIKEFGRLDILVNNAGIYPLRPWDQIFEEEWDHVFAVNTKSCFLCARAAVPYMKKNQPQSPGRCVGKIISIASVTFFLGNTGFLHYVASKGGVVGFTRALARELGPEEITVNGIAPGAIPTDSEKNLPDQEGLNRSVLEKQSLKRRATTDDVAHAVLFFASPRSDFITGQTLEVDGGWYMH